MADSQSKKRWNKEHILYVTTKLYEKGDRDILEYLEGRARATEIKKALRYYMLHHPEEWEGHPLHDALKEEKQPKGDRTMTIRESMKSGENLGWCKPYVGGKNAIVICEGRANSLMLNGKEVEMNAENLKRFAKAVNPDYADYAGYDDTHIALEGDIRECGCRDCPWFDSCDAMDGEADC